MCEMTRRALLGQWLFILRDIQERIRPVTITGHSADKPACLLLLFSIWQVSLCLILESERSTNASLSSAVENTPQREQLFLQDKRQQHTAPVGNSYSLWLTQSISLVKHHEEACSGCSVRLIIIRGKCSPSHTGFWTTNLLRLIPWLLISLLILRGKYPHCYL